MALNYAQQWSPELLEILIQGTITSPFITSNVKWVGARTFHFTQTSTSGFKNHNRNGGWNKGSFAQKDVPYTVEHDRDISFLVDKADVDETNATASRTFPVCLSRHRLHRRQMHCSFPRLHRRQRKRKDTIRKLQHPHTRRRKCSEC